MSSSCKASLALHHVDKEVPVSENTSSQRALEQHAGTVAVACCQVMIFLGDNLWKFPTRKESKY